MIIDYLHNNKLFVPVAAKWIFEEWGRHTSGSSVDRIEKWLRRSPGGSGLPISMVATEQDVPVGLSRLVANDMDTRQDLTPWLASLFVPPEIRNHGIASTLIQKVLQEAVALGFSTCYLYTPDQERFYARRGWHLLEHTTYRNRRVSVMHIETKGEQIGPPDSEELF